MPHARNQGRFRPRSSASHHPADGSDVLLHGHVHDRPVGGGPAQRGCSGRPWLHLADTRLSDAADGGGGQRLHGHGQPVPWRGQAPACPSVFRPDRLSFLCDWIRHCAAGACRAYGTAHDGYGAAGHSAHGAHLCLCLCGATALLLQPCHAEFRLSRAQDGLAAHGHPVSCDGHQVCQQRGAGAWLVGLPAAWLCRRGLDDVCLVPGGLCLQYHPGRARGHFTGVVICRLALEQAGHAQVVARGRSCGSWQCGRTCGQHRHPCLRFQPAPARCGLHCRHDPWHARSGLSAFPHGRAWHDPDHPWRASAGRGHGA